MNAIQFIQSEPSVFAQLVDVLRNKSEAELKMLYLRLFQTDLADEWAALTKDIDFSNVSDEEIVNTIQKNRYRG